MSSLHFRVLPLLSLTALMVGSAAQAQGRAFPSDTVNIAAATRGGRVVSVSSVLDNQNEYSADNLIDGKIIGTNNKGSYGWASNRYDPINLEYVTIGFKDNAVKTVGRIVINPSAYVARERWAKDVSVQVTTGSVEEGPYNTVAEISLRQSPEPQEFRFLPTEARFVRLAFRTNYGSDRSVALGEVELYEAITGSDPIVSVISELEGSINDLKKFQKAQLELGNNSPNSPVTGSGATPLSNVNMAAKSNGGRIVDASATFESERGQGPDPAYGPEKLIDGKVWTKDDKSPSFGWSSQGFTPGQQWVILGFKDDRTQPVGKIIVNPLSYQPRDRWARRIDVQVSTEPYKKGDDFKAFRTVKTLNLRSEGVPQEFEVGPVEAKYVRLVFTANGPGDVQFENTDPDINSDRAVSLGEVEIYPPRLSNSELDQLISRFSQVLLQLKQLRRSGTTLAAAEGTGATAVETIEEVATEPEVTAVKTAALGTRIKSPTTPTKRKP
jgi:hypothetical protein